MGTFKSLNELENKTADSHVVDHLRSRMEDMVKNPLFAEAYNISKTYLECFWPMQKISSGQSCSTEKTFNFEKNVTCFKNSKSKDSSMVLPEFETRSTHVKTNTKNDDRNQISLLQDKMISSTVENVPIIESLNSTESISSSKARHSVRNRRGLRERPKNFSIQKGMKPSVIKKVNSSCVFASKVEIKALLSNQSNSHIGKTGTPVDEIPPAEVSAKKRKYKVKVKVRRIKLKREASPPPPPPPKLPPPPQKLLLQPLPSPPKLPLLPPPPPPPELTLPPPPPPPKLPLTPIPPSPNLSLPPSLPKLPRSLQLQVGSPSLPSCPRSRLPPPPISPPISALSSSRPPILDHLPGNSKSRNFTWLPPYAPGIMTMIRNHQLQQAVQTSQCNVNQLHYLQATGHNVPCTLHNNYPSFLTTPHTAHFCSNYPSTLNAHMHVCQQHPVLSCTNQQPTHSKWNAGNFKR